MTKTFKLSDQETTEVKKIYFDLIGHRSVLAEMANSNPGSAIKDTQVYEDYKKLMESYDSIVDKVIRTNTDNAFSIQSQWRIDFEQDTLYVYTADISSNN